jgi:Bacterial regulatory protein, Fis family
MKALRIDVAAEMDVPLDEWTRRVVALRLRAALMATGGNVSEAARILRCGRNTFYRRLESPDAEDENVPHPGPLPQRIAGEGIKGTVLFLPPRSVAGEGEDEGQKENKWLTEPMAIIAI